MEHDWQQTYHRLAELFGETPSAQLEQRVLDHFVENPARVKAQGEQLGKKIRSGADIRSGWAVLGKNLDDAATPNVVVTDTATEQRALLNARRWLHNAGVHFQHEEQVLAELFDHQGLLADHDTPRRRSEIAEAWKQERQRQRPQTLDPHSVLQAEELPDWVRRLKAARRKGDQRLFPEQAPGILELHEAHLAESTLIPTRRQLEKRPDLYKPGVKVSGYEAEVLLLAAAETDATVYVQPWEYAEDEEPADTLPY